MRPRSIDFCTLTPARPAETEDEAQAHTIGIPGAGSPTATRTACTLWHSLADSTLIMCNPKLEVATSAYGYDQRTLFIWVIVWWRPVQHYRGMLRPDQWHSTLVRATCRAHDPEATKERLRTIGDTLGMVLKQCVNISPYPLRVTRAPWRRSWNFGLAGDTFETCTTIRNLADYMLRREPDIAIQPHWELHISWH